MKKKNVGMFGSEFLNEMKPFTKLSRLQECQQLVCMSCGTVIGELKLVKKSLGVQTVTRWKNKTFS